MEEEGAEAAAQEDRQTDGLMSSVSPTSCLWLLLMPVGRHDHQMIGDHMSAAARVLQAIKTIIIILLLDFDLDDNVCMHTCGTGKITKYKKVNLG